MRALAAQWRTEITLSARQGEQLLVSFGIPLLVLVFFSTVDVLPIQGEAVDTLAPAVLALAVMSTSMVSLGIGTAFERQYGVLKRLGSTPLGRGRLVTAKCLLVGSIEVVQLTILVVAALLLGWDPAGGWLPAAAAVALGTAAFAGIGLLMAGTLKGTTTLALANGAYLVLLLTGGMVVPLDELPGGVAAVARAFPAAALTETLTATFAGSSVPGWAWIVLGIWAFLAPIAAGFLFRWGYDH